MNNIHRSAIIQCMPELLKRTSLSLYIMANMVKNDIITNSQREDILSLCPSKQKCMFYDICKAGSRRRFGSLLKVFRNNHQEHISDIIEEEVVKQLAKANIKISDYSKAIEYNIHGQDMCATNFNVIEVPIEIDTSSNFFNHINNEVDTMKPVAVENERSTKPQYKVAVDIYSLPLPTMSVGLSEVPYLAALDCKIARSKVSQWPNSPSLDDLTTGNEKFQADLQNVREFMKNLVGGFRFKYDIENKSFDNLIKVLDMRTKDRLFYYNGTVVIVDIPYYKSSEYTANALDNLAIIIAMMSFGTNRSFVIRRDFAPNPSAYLILNTYNVKTGVIMSAHKNICLSIMQEDESTQPIESKTTMCPF